MSSGARYLMGLKKVLRSILVAIPVIVASPVLVLAIQGGMFLPVGMFVAIYSPWTPFVWFPQTKWLVTHTIWMSRATRSTLVDVGWILIAACFVVFIASYIYFYSVRGRAGLVTGGPYAIVRHPQYLGIFIGLTGVTLLEAGPLPGRPSGGRGEAEEALVVVAEDFDHAVPVKAIGRHPHVG